MAREKKTYLSKNGKVFGPFDQGEVDDLKIKGELEKFFWICTDLKKGWSPLHSPPPLPVEAPEEVSSSGIQTRVQSAPEPQSLVPSILALCHNYRVILSGTIKDVNTEGCTLTHVSPASKAMPIFQRGSRVSLNLLNSDSRESQNIDAKVNAAIKNDGFWDYRISWEKVPEILKRT